MAEFIFKANAAVSRAVTPVKEAFKLEQAELADIKLSARVSAFFSRSDLMDLINLFPECNGLRMYPALNTNGNFTILVVAADAEKNDLVDSSEPPCFVAENGSTASRLTTQEGVDIVRSVRTHISATLKNPNANLDTVPFAINATPETEQNFSKVFFSRATIENLLDTNASASGIRFFSAKINFEDDSPSFNTLVAMRVGASGRDTTTAVLSALPCPPSCGGGSYLDDFILNNEAVL